MLRPRHGLLALGLLLLPLLLATARAAEERQLASTGADPVELWRQHTASAAKVVEEALRRQDPGHSVEVKHIDLESLRIRHGQRLELALEVESNMYRFFTESEPEWHALADALPAASGQGAVVPRTDWQALERHWVAPVAQGPLLPDFILEGPLDLYLRQPTALQLFLPHPADVGRLTRVLLREGACVTVRGARSVGLRRPVDLPALSLGDFASLVTTDAHTHPAAGILHLVEGVRSAAVQRWNVSHPDLSLAVVSLELEFSPHSGALLSAPSHMGDHGLQRLKPRKLKEGVVELSPRDSLSEEQSKAVALAPGAPYAWPLRGVHPQHLQAYERLLREVLSSQVFSPQGPAGGKAGAGGGVRVQPDLQLRLHRTAAEAMTLLHMQVEVERRPKAAAQGGEQKGGAAAQGEAGAAGARQGGLAAAGADGAGAPAAGGEGAGRGLLEQPPDTLGLLVQPKYGPHEVYDTVLQMRQDPETGALRFVPLAVTRAGGARETVSFSQAALQDIMAGFSGGNFTAQQLEEMAQQHEEL